MQENWGNTGRILMARNIFAIIVSSKRILFIKDGIYKETNSILCSAHGWCKKDQKEAKIL